MLAWQASSLNETALIFLFCPSVHAFITHHNYCDGLQLAVRLQVLQVRLVPEVAGQQAISPFQNTRTHKQ